MIRSIATQSVTSLVVRWLDGRFADWQHREIRLTATPNDSVHCNTISVLPGSTLARLVIRGLAKWWDSLNCSSEWFTIATRPVSSLVVLWLDW